MIRKYELYCKHSMVGEEHGEYRVTSTTDVYEVAKALHMTELPMEKVYAMYFDSKGNLIGVMEVSSGGVSTSLIDNRIVLSAALTIGRVNSMILCHNHPSGDVEPSENDDKATRSLKKAGQVVGVSLNDHVIVSEYGYYSYKEHGRLK